VAVCERTSILTGPAQSFAAKEEHDRNSGRPFPRSRKRLKQEIFFNATPVATSYNAAVLRHRLGAKP
jgi:hypothetical protein